MHVPSEMGRTCQVELSSLEGGREVTENDYELTMPKPIGTLKINENFSILLYDKLPNRFHRWMARVLLGWEYKEKNSDGD